MRSGPGTSNSVLVTIPDGSDVDLGNCNEAGTWCSVTYNNQNGFVSGQYLKESDDPNGWPRAFDTDGGGKIVLYQPQITAWDDFKTIEALTAVEYATGDLKNPVFGVIGFRGDTQADSENNQVVISNITVTEVNFSSLGRDDLSKLQVAVGKLLPTGPITISEERITASLAEQKRMTDVKGLNTAPPPIFHSTTPALLVQTNGPVTMGPVENVDDLQFVINTNWDIFQTTGDKTYYLRDDSSWLSASALDGDWSAVDTLPDVFSKLPDSDNWKDAKAAVPAKPFENGAPKVFYSDKPAELIVFQGDPKKEAVPDTALEWISNTESDVFFDTANNTWYALLSGRWFSAASLDGPWTFATPNLPADFRHIPSDVPYYSVRYSVPGTSESEEARLKASIPHTARVEVGSVKPDVTYGGDPKFEPIEGTSMSYATNTNVDVIEVDGHYYVLQNGVWFVGDTPTGPFEVATSVPDAIYTIPPSSPVYNTTYVRVYDTEPGAVWFGYTMGYLGGLLAWNTFVYGTGWYYPPYWGAPYGPYRWPGYYPRPITYGLGAYYNPVRGVYGRYGYAYGPYRGLAGGAAYNPRTGTYIRGGAAWGPGGERGFVAAYNPRTGTGAVARGGHNVYGSWGTAGVRRGSDWARISGGSNDAGGRGVHWSRGSGDQGFVGEGRRGNVYAGRDGNVYRNTGDGWQKFGRDGWNNVDRPDPGDLRGPGDGPIGGGDRNRPAADRGPGPVVGGSGGAGNLAPNRGPGPARPDGGRPADRGTGPARPGGDRVANRAPQHLDQDRRARELGNQRIMRDRGGFGGGGFEGGGRAFGGGGREFGGGGGFRGGGGFHGGGGGFRRR
ncbi:hypothetical protein JCR33_07170 [Acuticoccus sp. 2012]|uniref:SH3b domain-containing protein n=2 Tax=Acuticoccus mangrovi TaxID=2796142 RepID=A0A934IN21_9HYPH|nr:hypothetical protein [Acuticoccus mangrovi]